jgi:DNA polymerase-3 subunit alpha
MNFTPLHIYSGYSFLNSGLTIERIISLLKKNNFSSCGLCDKNTLSGLPPFAKAMEKEKYHYLAGIDEIIDNFLVSLFAIDENGYQNLLKIINLASKQPISLNDIKTLNEGLVMILPTSQDNFKHAFQNNKEQTIRYLVKLSSITQHFYFGLEVDDESYNDSIREFANKYTYEVIAYPFIKYDKKEDALVLEIVRAIDEERTLDYKTKEGPNYFLNQDELNHYYKKEELDKTNDISKESTFNFEIKRGELPVFHNQENLPSDIYLSQKVHDGLIQKLGTIDESHSKRLEYELQIIKKMGYCDYFLIVADYVNFAKTHSITVGPGRGSAAGSLVSYALGIVMVDPLEYGLMFERFLNPERQSMPDIDIDFSDIRRYEAIDYLVNKYGEDKVAHIVTIQTIGAKQALRDIGRVYNIAIREIDLISKKIVDSNLSLRDDYRHNKQFRELVDSDKYYLEIVSLASKIEGLPRQSGLHAAGIVLNNKPLYTAVPTIVDGENGSICTYEMNYLEEQGILKMDLLGLRNLTVIDNCLALININHHLTLKYEDIPFKDEKAIKLVASGKTMGVFQLESVGMKKAIETIKIESFEDVVALLALYRPGPMANIPNYARRKAGIEKIDYFSPILKEILSPTYGIIVYQEQIMQIVRSVAGFSYGEADLFRRAISKKDSAKLASLKTKFLDGAHNNNFSPVEAEKIFGLIYRFADYGFNRSHSLSYAVLAMQMAYLKAHYSAEFYAAILENSSGTNDSKFNETIAEMRSLNIEIVGPNINESHQIYYVKDAKLVFSLSSIKGIPYPLADSIVKERVDNGPYKSFNDFLIRNVKNNISNSQIMSLIDAGSFDLLDPSRASLRASTAQSLEYAQMVYNSSGSLFENDLSFIPLPHYIVVKDDKFDNLNREYQVLGIMISGTPLSLFSSEINKINHISIIEALERKDTITIICIVQTIKILTTRKNHETMAFISAYDDSGQIEITIFPELYSKTYKLLKENNVIKVEGRIDFKRNNTLIANQIELVEVENV